MQRGLGQVTYFNYLDSTVQWTTHYSYPDGDNHYSIDVYDNYIVYGDTLIGNKWYWNIYSISHSIYKGNTNYGYLHPSMALREDSTHRFYSVSYFNQTPKEEVWCDFNHHLGDTLYYNGYTAPFLTDKIDTVYLGSRMLLEFSSIFPYAIVEGIGVSYNGSYNNYLKCFEKQNDIYSLSNDCNFYSSISELSYHQTTYLIYPNPADNVLAVKLLNNICTRISITDISGKEILQINNYQTEQPIDISCLHDGIYFIRLIGSKETEVKKFITLKK